MSDKDIKAQEAEEYKGQLSGNAIARSGNYMSDLQETRADVKNRQNQEADMSRLLLFELEKSLNEDMAGIRTAMKGLQAQVDKTTDLRILLEADDVHGMRSYFKKEHDKDLSNHTDDQVRDLTFTEFKDQIENTQDMITAMRERLEHFQDRIDQIPEGNTKLREQLQNDLNAEFDQLEIIAKENEINFNYAQTEARRNLDRPNSMASQYQDDFLEKGISNFERSSTNDPFYLSTGKSDLKTLETFQEDTQAQALGLTDEMPQDPFTSEFESLDSPTQSAIGAEKTQTSFSKSIQSDDPFAETAKSITDPFNAVATEMGYGEDKNLDITKSNDLEVITTVGAAPPTAKIG